MLHFLVVILVHIKSKSCHVFINLILRFFSVLVRTILASCVIISYNQLSKTLEKQFGSKWLQWFTAITVSQSHFMFYLSRPLPNIMALPLGNLY